MDLTKAFDSCHTREVYLGRGRVKLNFYHFMINMNTKAYSKIHYAFRMWMEFQPGNGQK